MKTYHSNNDSSGRFNKKTLMTVLSCAGVLVIALAVTLTLLLNREKTPVGGDVPTGSQITFVLPMSEYTVGQTFSVDELVYSKTLNQWRTHRGVDFLASKGTAVSAIADGKVTSVKNTNLDGYVVTISHSGGYVSTYKSLGSTLEVEEGDNVKAGDKLGTVDITMVVEQSEGAHLHLEMTLNGKLVDPANYLPTIGDK